MPSKAIYTPAEAAAVRAQILDNAARAAAWLRSFDGDPMALLKAARFDTIGYDPLSGEPLNIVEQINQSFTILVSLRAVEQLFKMHPDAGGFRLALGTTAGRDIESIVPNLVAAETFAATRPDSNRKLAKDLARLNVDPARHRYVFFAAPGYGAGRQEKMGLPGIEVHAVNP